MAGAEIGFRARDPTGEQILVQDVILPRDIDPEFAQSLFPLAIQMLNEPDEIWYEWTDQPLGGAVACFEMEKAGVVRRYLARFEVGDTLLNLTALTTVAPDGWRLRQMHLSETALNAARRGWLAFRRE